MDRSKMIDYFLNKIERREIELDGIRKEMEKNNLPEEDIRAVVRAVDSELRNHLGHQSHQNRARQLKIMGVSLLPSEYYSPSVLIRGCSCQGILSLLFMAR